MNTTADERIIQLVKPEYLERIPSFVRRRAEERSCQLIAKMHPDIYDAFSQETAPSEDAKRQMAQIVNACFAERIKNHYPC